MCFCNEYCVIDNLRINSMLKLQSSNSKFIQSYKELNAIKILRLERFHESPTSCFTKIPREMYHPPPPPKKSRKDNNANGKVLLRKTNLPNIVHPGVVAWR